MRYNRRRTSAPPIVLRRPPMPFAFVGAAGRPSCSSSAPAGRTSPAYTRHGWRRTATSSSSRARSPASIASSGPTSRSTTGCFRRTLIGLAALGSCRSASSAGSGAPLADGPAGAAATPPCRTRIVAVLPVHPALVAGVGVALADLQPARVRRPVGLAPQLFALLPAFSGVVMAGGVALGFLGLFTPAWYALPIAASWAAPRS